MAIVSTGTPHRTVDGVRRAAHRLQWATLTITDLNQLAWTLSMNPPSVAVIVGGAQSTAVTAAVEIIRGTGSVPILVVGELPPAATVTALMAGADTVVGAGIGEEELAARLLALLRRSADGSTGETRLLTAGDLRVDLWRREVELAGEAISLSDTEFRLLVCLMESAGRVLAYQHLISRVWGVTVEHGINGLRIYVARLRKKLGGGARNSSFIRSVRGHGYQFTQPVVEVGDDDTGRSSITEAMVQRLGSMCDLLARAPEFEAAAGSIAESLVAEGTVDAVGLHLATGSTLKLVAYEGFSTDWEHSARDLELSDSRFASSQAVATAEPVQVRLPNRSCYPGTSSACSSEPPGTYLFIPLKSRGTAMGSMGVLRHSTEPFGRLTINYLTAVAGLCGACLGLHGPPECR